LDRLYSKGRVLGHKRAKRNSSPNTSLLQIEGVGSKEEAQFYLGKVRRPLAFFDPQILNFTLSACSIRLQGQEGAPGIKGPSYLGVRVTPLRLPLVFLYMSLSRVTRPHGNSGVVKGKFRSNLPPHAFGASVRVVRQIDTFSLRNHSYNVDRRCCTPLPFDCSIQSPFPLVMGNECKFLSHRLHSFVPAKRSAVGGHSERNLHTQCIASYIIGGMNVQDMRCMAR